MVREVDAAGMRAETWRDASSLVVAFPDAPDGRRTGSGREADVGLDLRRRTAMCKSRHSAGLVERLRSVEAVCKRLVCFGARPRLPRAGRCVSFGGSESASPYALISAISVLAPRILIARRRL